MRRETEQRRIDMGIERTHTRGADGRVTGTKSLRTSQNLGESPCRFNLSIIYNLHVCVCVFRHKSICCGLRHYPPELGEGIAQLVEDNVNTERAPENALLPLDTDDECGGCLFRLFWSTQFLCFLSSCAFDLTN